MRIAQGIETSLLKDGQLTSLGKIGLVILVSLILGLALAFLKPPLVLAGALGFLAGLAVMRSAQVGLWALIGVATLLPFGAIPISLGFFPTFLDAALLGLFGVWLARALTGRQGGWINTPLDLPLLSFLLLACASFIAGMAYAPLTRDTLRHFLEVLLAISLFFVVVNTVIDRNILQRTVAGVMAAGTVAALLGVVFYILPQRLTVSLLSLLRVFHYPAGFGVLRFIEDDPTKPLRAISTSIDPNVLGGLLVLVGALTAPQLFARRPLLPRPLVGAMLATMGLCLFLTFSRGALTGLVAALVLQGTLRYRSLLVLLVVGGLLVLAVPFSQTYVLHFMAGLRGQDLATQMRLGEYKDALDLISRYPWFGVGFQEAPTIDLYVGVSSVYLLMAENMGLIGLGAFLLIMAIFLVHLWSAFREMPRAGEGEVYILGLGGAIFGALVAGLFDHYFFNLDFPHSVSIFWLYVGLAMAAVRLYRKPLSMIDS